MVILPQNKVAATESTGNDVEKEPARNVIQVIQGGNYAVFSYARPKNDRDIPLMSRILSRYIFKEWVPINHKRTNTLGFTYEIFTKDRVYLYLPMQPGMDVGTEVTIGKFAVSEWADYIDSHIRDELSTESLAFIAGYSVKNYRELFQLYYGITPAEYVRRRRRYLAGEASDQAANNGIAGDIDIGLVEVTTEVMPERTALLNEIREQNGKDTPGDILGLIAYWFTHDFDAFVGVREMLSEDSASYEKIFIWGNDPNYVNGQTLYRYYIGGFLKDASDAKSVSEFLIDNSKDEHESATSGISTQIVAMATGAAGNKANESSGEEENLMRLEKIPGGKYAIISSREESDLNELETIFVTLHRLAFGAWIQSHRSRVDLSKRTFVIWHSNKLYFYVPLIG